jgi:hypothetical protein
MADLQTDDDIPLDPKLYRCQLIIEQMNPWQAGFKTLLVCYETSLHK